MRVKKEVYVELTKPFLGFQTGHKCRLLAVYPESEYQLARVSVLPDGFLVNITLFTDQYKTSSGTAKLTQRELGITAAPDIFAEELAK